MRSFLTWAFLFLAVASTTLGQQAVTLPPGGGGASSIGFWYDIVQRPGVDPGVSLLTVAAGSESPTLVAVPADPLFGYVEPVNGGPGGAMNNGNLGGRLHRIAISPDGLSLACAATDVATHTRSFLISASLATTPPVVTVTPLPGNPAILNVLYSGNRVGVAWNPALPDAQGCITVVDLSTPTAPTVVGSLGVGSWIPTAAATDPFAYCTVYPESMASDTLANGANVLVVPTLRGMDVVDVGSLSVVASHVLPTATDQARTTPHRVAQGVYAVSGCVDLIVGGPAGATRAFSLNSDGTPFVNVPCLGEQKLRSLTNETLGVVYELTTDGTTNTGVLYGFVFRLSNLAPVQTRIQRLPEGTQFAGDLSIDPTQRLIGVGAYSSTTDFITAFPTTLTGQYVSALTGFYSILDVKAPVWTADGLSMAISTSYGQEMRTLTSRPNLTFSTLVTPWLTPSARVGNDSTLGLDSALPVYPTLAAISENAGGSDVAVAVPPLTGIQAANGAGAPVVAGAMIDQCTILTNNGRTVDPLVKTASRGIQGLKIVVRLPGSATATIRELRVAGPGATFVHHTEISGRR